MSDLPEEQRLVDLYVSDIEKYPALSADEQAALLQRIAHGAGDDADAASRALIESNLRMVVDIARTHETTGSRLLLDLIQDGNLGLMRAVQGFDGESGVPFGDFAASSIREAIVQGA